MEAAISLLADSTGCLGTGSASYTELPVVIGVVNNPATAVVARTDAVPTRKAPTAAAVYLIRLDLVINANLQKFYSPRVY